ncbi:MAG: hypothetical protein ACI8YD_001759, partial [Rheinheimera aquimaris]
RPAVPVTWQQLKVNFSCLAAIALHHCIKTGQTLNH